MSVFDLRGLAALAALALLPSCAQEVTASDKPNVQALLSAYAQPSGTIDPAHPEAFLRTVEEHILMVGGGEADVIFSQIVTIVMTRISHASIAPKQNSLVKTRVDGIMRFKIPCGTSSNETADIAAEIANGKLADLIWGTANDCPLWRGASADESYNGSFTIYRYPDGNTLFFRIQGSIAILNASVAIDFRLVDGHIETRVALPTGDVIAYRTGSEIALRAANGSFSCEILEDTCK
jgi:hypothetical protein